MTKPKNFNCSIDNMYATILMAWQFCLGNLAKFTSAHPFYTKKYVNDAIAQIKEVQALLNQGQRNADTTKKRQSLMDAADQCLANWQVLKTYIMNGFTEAVATINLRDAGAVYYLKAVKYNWSAMRTMVKMGNAFLNKNKADLVARLIMPADFADKFAADASIFTTQNTAFQKSQA